ncbi:hypothetical protein BH23BAC3_BH23BAC3_28600 [soil metagenome]
MKIFFSAFCILLIGSAFSIANAQHKYSVHSEISIASMQNNKLSDGAGFLFNIRRSFSEKWGADVGFSFSQSLNKVRSDDPSVIRNPDRIKEGYLHTSLDVFAGAVFNDISDKQLTFPVGAGLLMRSRSETFYDSDSETILVQNRLVVSNPNYRQSIDFGLYLLISAQYSANEKWSFGIQSRHQFYTRGFSIFKLGLSARHHF